MIEATAKALEMGLGLKREQQRIIVRTLWVLSVTGHVFWICGFLAGFGLAAPFARASDVDELKRAQAISVRISMQQELRTQTRAWCVSTDPEIRALALRRIDELRADLRDVSKVETAEPRCEAPQ